MEKRHRKRKISTVQGDFGTLAGNPGPVEDVMRSQPKKIRQALQTIYKKVGML